MGLSTVDNPHTCFGVMKYVLLTGLRYTRFCRNHYYSKRFVKVHKNITPKQVWGITLNWGLGHNICRKVGEF